MLVSTALHDRFFFIHWFIPPKHVLNVPVLPINTGPSKSNRWLSGVEAIFSGMAEQRLKGRYLQIWLSLVTMKLYNQY